MKPVTEQKCPSCGAPLRFDAKLGKLVCEHCGNRFDIPADGEIPAEEIEIDGVDLAALNEQAADENAAALPIYNCVSCGAEVIAPPEQVATACPYCGNNIVLTNKVSGKLRPDGIIPFRIDRAGLPGAVRAFYKGKVLLPRRFFSDSRMGKVTGVYVPFWIFSGRLTGVVRYHCETSSEQRRGDFVVTETDHYETGRDVDVSFADLPVDASGRISDKLMDSLEPFDMAERKPFDIRYLAGFTADRFDQAKDDMAERALERMRTTAEAAAGVDVAAEFTRFDRIGGSLRAALDASYMLLPVYLFSLSFGGKEYPFAVNGQTGKVVGELPTDKKVCRRYYLLRFLAAGAAVAAVFLVRYFMGR